ncbi:MAG TPA: hypothetical protein VEI57_13160 [Nitrospirota bacterium]|nr:hypothetical protein [Nitrospirota bacterium]
MTAAQGKVLDSKLQRDVRAAFADRGAKHQRQSRSGELVMGGKNTGRIPH